MPVSCGIGFGGGQCLSRADYVIGTGATKGRPRRRRMLMLAILQTTLTRLAWRWRHLVSAAEASALSYGKNMEIYEEALELLHA